MLLGHPGGDPCGPLELAYRLDDVVGRRHQHDGRRIAAGDQGAPRPMQAAVSRPHGSPTT